MLEGFAAGIFIHVACLEMLAPELQEGGHNVLKALTVFGGSLTFFIFNYVIAG